MKKTPVKIHPALRTTSRKEKHSAPKSKPYFHPRKNPQFPGKSSNYVDIKRVCGACSSVQVFELEINSYNSLMRGEYTVHELFPELSKLERRFIAKRRCKKCK